MHLVCACTASRKYIESQCCKNSGESYRGVNEGLSDPPHHGVGGEHVEPAVLVYNGHRGGGHEAEGAGDYGPHHEDHHAVELSQLVASQHREGD